jgi:NitT/TauT family transport system ATP-binding protein
MTVGLVASAAPPRIVIDGLSKVFALPSGDVPALERVDLVVGEGEFCCVVGPSGCGKTTLLRVLAGLESQTSGEVRIRRSTDGHPVSATVFQEHSVFPWMTVSDNVGYGLWARGVGAQARERAVKEYVEKVGLARFASLYPHQLSGGMKQRVGVARAFAADPDVLLMDEPFGALDEQTRALLQQELTRVWEQSGKTVVFVTHSIDEAVALADRVILMTARPGRIKSEIAIPLPRPRSVLELKSQPEFGALVAQVWEVLRDEALRAHEETRLL